MSTSLETGTTFSSLTVERVSEILRTFPRLLRDVEGAAQLFMTTSEATRVPFLEAILRGEDSDVVFAVSRSLGVNLSALASTYCRAYITGVFLCTWGLITRLD